MQFSSDCFLGEGGGSNIAVFPETMGENIAFWVNLLCAAY